jgi:hypothetical protein
MSVVKDYTLGSVSMVKGYTVVKPPAITLVTSTVNRIVPDGKMTFYDFAYAFLIENLHNYSVTPTDVVTPVDIEQLLFSYFRAFYSMEHVYESLLISSQNRYGANAIKYSANRTQIEKVLCDFDVNAVLSTYTNYSEIYDAFQKAGLISAGKVNGAWENFAKSAYDGAQFFKPFKSLLDFKNYVSGFNSNYITRGILCKIIASKVRGIEFCLACDFLKELGYTDYPKPDTHIKDVLSFLYFKSNMSEEDAYRQMVRLTKICEYSQYAQNPQDVNAYSLDKIIWLIYSGDFYNVGIKGKGLGDEFKCNFNQYRSQIVY